MKSRLNVAVLYRPGRNVEWHNKIAGQQVPDDAIEEASIHRDGLEAAGHNAHLVKWTPHNLSSMLDELKKFDIVFNASSLPEVAFLEAAGIPYCGSGLDLVALDKATRKKLLAYHGVSTAPFVVVEADHAAGGSALSLSELKKGWEPEPPLAYPMFVKPVRGRGSQGISDDSIVEDHASLVRQVELIISKLEQGALVESYLKGREVTVGVVGNPPTVLPPLEIEYNQARTNSFVHKMDNEIMHCPARITPEQTEKARQVAMATFSALGARDFGRIDTILTEDGTPWVLEINTFAGLQILTGKESHLHQSYIGAMAKQLDWDMAELVNRILDSARQRYNI